MTRASSQNVGKFYRTVKLSKKNVRFIYFLQVSHVVSFDFPYSLPDYLHRVGRTGRVGSVAGKCRATTFMSHRRDVVLAWKVKVH